MLLINIQDEDFVNYKKPSMVIAFPHCSFKCGKDICQNAQLEKSIMKSVQPEVIIQRFLDNPIAEAIVCAGLEPLDSESDLIELIYSLRVTHKSTADIVIYTGYTQEECVPFIKKLLEVCGWGAGHNIIMKYGRYVPNENPHYDETLGVHLASDNQYAERIFEHTKAL